MLRSRREEETDPPILGDLAIADDLGRQCGDEPPSQAGAMTAILLALFSGLRALELAYSYGYTLTYGFRRGSTFDLRWAVGGLGLLSIALLITSNRFATWFAPGSSWKVARLTVAAVGVMLVTISVQPLMVMATGLTPSRRTGNVFFGPLDPPAATFGPFLLGVIILVSCAAVPRLPKPAEADEPTA